MTQDEQKIIARALDQRGVLFPGTSAKKIIGRFTAQLYDRPLTEKQERTLLKIFQEQQFRFPELWREFGKRIAEILAG